MDLLLETASFEYVGEVNPSLECAICRTAFHNPAMSPLCQHIFCTACIVRALETSQTCPIDRSVLSLEDLVEAPRIISQLVNELVVTCPHAASGCKVTCERGLLAGHLRDECIVQMRKDIKGKGKAVDVKGLSEGWDAEEQEEEQEILTCEHCLDAVRANLLQAHSAECGAVPVPCLHCATALPRSTHASHFLTCPSILIPCPHASFGCTQRLPRSFMTQEHLEVSCHFEPIKDWLEGFRQKMSDTELENAVLRRRCDGLEDGMKEMRHLMEGLKQGLGEFYISPPPSASTLPPKSPLETVDDAKEPLEGSPTKPTLSTVQSVPQPIVIENPSRFASPPPDPFLLSTSGTPPHINARSSSLPPPAIPIPARTTTPTRSTSTSPSQGRHLFPPRPPIPPSFSFPLYTSSTSFTTPRNSSHTIPSATLPDTLNSLSRQISTLESSISTIESRQSSALMNETIRIQDDLVSIKSVLHGMRLQMHGMMMEVARLSGGINPMNGGMGSPPIGIGLRGEGGSGSDGGEGSNSDDDGVGQGPTMMPRFRYFSPNLPQMHVGPPPRMGPMYHQMGGGIKL